MYRIETLQQYEKLINEYRRLSPSLFYNNYFMTEEVERYINKGRLFYEEIGAGVIFFYDEERYYRACLCVDTQQKIQIPALDKKVLIRNVYRKDRKEESMIAADQQLVEGGFAQVGTTVQLRGDVAEVYEKSQSVERFVRSLEKKGYRCVVAEESEFDKVEEMLLNSQIIKDYQLDYLEPDERQKGAYLYIANAQGEMCGASVVITQNEIAHGIGVAIKEKYQLMGLAPVLAYYRMKWLCENRVKSIVAWALVDNEPSLRYHCTLGYKMGKRYAEEWIRE